MPRQKGKGTIATIKRLSMPLTVATLVKDYIYIIDLDADYQREKVWSNSEQEKLLDSIARGIDIPKLYLAKVSGNKQFEYECIDGKQRLLTLRAFLDPDPDDPKPLKLEIMNERYSYVELRQKFSSLADTIDEFVLDFVVYDESSLTENFVREIFRRLQLGIRLNSGELLNSAVGTIRDFIFKDVGRDGPFLRNTRLSEKRFSRQFTLAQICINSFNRHRNGSFKRARLQDLEDFFGDEASLPPGDSNLRRIREVLRIMDRDFGPTAESISSRAVAVSAYLFVEDLVSKKKLSKIRTFAKFYLKLLQVISADMDLISAFKRPKNTFVLEEFQKYVLQASVEPYAIKRRHEFLAKAFTHYLSTKTKGKIISG